MKKGLLLLVFMMCAHVLYAKTSMDELKEMIAAREGNMNTHIEFKSDVSNIKNTRDSFFKSHNLLFFFASTCPFCHRMSPILKEWADTHGAYVEARSFDDKPLAEFQDPLPATKELVEVAYFGQEIRYPAIFIMNNKTRVLVPVSFGIMNEKELDTRLTGMITKIEAIERRIE